MMNHVFVTTHDPFMNCFMNLVHRLTYESNLVCKLTHESNLVCKLTHESSLVCERTHEAYESSLVQLTHEAAHDTQENIVYILL